MDLIYADKNLDDVGVLTDYQFDLAYGSDENDFELTVSLDNHVCDEDYLIYIEGTEYGGIIDSIEVNTADKSVKYSGRTYHGIIDRKIIQPDANTDYYTISGDANAIIRTLITRLGLSSIFKGTTETSTSLTNYQFDRYVSGYKGICKMLQSVGYKLHMEFNNKFVELSAVPKVSYSDDEGLDSDRITFDIKSTFNPVNHLICLGSGTLRNRTVIHLYMDANRNISTTQTYTGVEEIAEVYDYPNVESSSELMSKGKEKLKEQDSTAVEIALGDNYDFGIGDVITVTDTTTGISVTRTIIKKIVTINNGVFKINYKVGE